VRNLRRHDYWSRVRFRMNEYGIPLFVADYLTRRLRLKPWQKQIRMKLNKLEKAKLK
jgi:hypothetical protein